MKFEVLDKYDLISFITDKTSVSCVNTVAILLCQC